MASDSPLRVPNRRGPELDAFLERLRQGDAAAVDAVGRLFDELGLVPTGAVEVPPNHADACPDADCPRCKVLESGPR